MKNFFESFRITANVLNQSLDVQYIPTNERIIELKLSGQINWEKLADILKNNPKSLQFSFTYSIPLQCVLLDLSTNEIIGKAQVDVTIDTIRLMRIILDNLVYKR